MKEMDVIREDDRVRRLQILEKKIRDPRSVSNVDCLLVRICYLNITLKMYKNRVTLHRVE